MFQLIQKMQYYLDANPMAKIGLMFDDTGNKHCVYITYIVYTDDGDQECDNSQQTDSMDAVPGSYIKSSRKTKVERLLLTMAAPLMDKTASNAGSLNVRLMEHFGVPLERLAGCVADHAALGNTVCKCNKLIVAC